MNYIISLILVIFGHAADYFSTRYALAHGAHEANPLVREVGLGNSKIIFAALTAFVLFFVDPPIRLLLSIGIACALFTVAAHNIYVVTKH